MRHPATRIATSVAARRPAAGSRVASAAEVHATRPRVLVVDDSPAVTGLVAAWLSDFAEVATVYSGAEALTRIHKTVPDLMVVDIVMPAVDGFQLVMHMRQHPRLAATPVIFITGIEQPASRYRALELGATALLHKPLDEDQVRATVRDALDDVSRLTALSATTSR